MLRAFQRADKEKAKVAELEREIREARELLDRKVSPNSLQTWFDERDKWLKRNAERENQQ